MDVSSLRSTGLGTTFTVKLVVAACQLAQNQITPMERVKDFNSHIMRVIQIL